MKKFTALFVYNLIANGFIVFCLCFNGILLGGFPLNYMQLGINFLFCFPIAMLIGLTFPISKISNWFASLFKINPNLKYANVINKFIGYFLGNLIFFIIINPSVSILNFFVFNDFTPLEALATWGKEALEVILVGYIATSIIDYPATRVAKLIYSDF